MFGSFKKKLKEAVDKLSGKIEEEVKPEVEDLEAVENVPVQEEKEEPVVENTDVGGEVLSGELHTEERSEGRVDRFQEGARGERSESERRIETIAEPAETEEEAIEERRVESEELKPVAEVPKKPVVDVVEKKLEVRTEAPKPVPVVSEAPKKEGLFSKLSKSFTDKTLSPEFLDEVLWDIEIALLENNVAEEVAQKIVSDLKTELSGKSVRKSKAEDIIKETMKKTIFGILDVPHKDVFDVIDSCNAEKRACLIVFVGFNGSGKTTTVAKMGKYFNDNDYSCVMAAADSFRAAAIEQLMHHGAALGIKVISQKYGTDPAAIIFDAKKHADARSINVVLADTAGRVHTDRNLIDEMKKIVRVNKPDLKFLVIESVAGNDVVEQAKVFDEIGLDGVILTKADVDDKGGSALSICYTLKKPVYFVGRGQEYSDIESFDAKKWVSSIFD